MRVDQAERGVVAHRADVAEVVGQAFQFGHQPAQPHRARRRGGAAGGLGGAREGERIGHGAVAGGSARQPRGVVRRASRHQPFQALVRVA